LQSKFQPDIRFRIAAVLNPTDAEKIKIIVTPSLDCLHRVSLRVFLKVWRLFGKFPKKHYFLEGCNLSLGKGSE
jgi:hypothetical protein